MDNIKVDKNYNFLEENLSPYSDEFDEKIEAIVNAKDNKIISDEEMKILIGFVFRREIGSKMENFVKEASMTNRIMSEKQTLFMQWNHNTTKHAT